MKVLITGGTGFIGSHLSKLLKNLGYSITLLSLEKQPITRLADVKYIYGNINDRSLMMRVVPNFDIVYHLAGMLGTSELIAEAHSASVTNILGTINVLDAALKKKTKVVHITKPNVWLNTYSITKEAGEKFTKMYYEQFGLPTVSVKWFNVYGPQQSFHCQKAVPFFIRWALRNEPLEIWGSGEQTMDLIYVEDAVRATVLIGEAKDLEGSTVEVGVGKETTVNELAGLIKKITDSNSRVLHLPMRAGETLNTKLVANTEALRSLNFRPKYTLKKGLEQTCGWYRKQLTAQ